MKILGLRASDFGLVLAPKDEAPQKERNHVPGTSLLLQVGVVVLVFSGGVVAANTVLPYWGGQRSAETLSYATALDLVKASSTHPSKRNSALGRVYVKVRMGIEALFECQTEPGTFGANARVWLKHIRDQVR